MKVIDAVFFLFYDQQNKTNIINGGYLVILLGTLGDLAVVSHK